MRVNIVEGALRCARNHVHPLPGRAAAGEDTACVLQGQMGRRAVDITVHAGCAVLDRPNDTPKGTQLPVSAVGDLTCSSSSKGTGQKESKRVQQQSVGQEWQEWQATVVNKKEKKKKRKTQDCQSAYFMV